MISIPSSMRALVLTGPGQSSVQEIPVPKVEYGSVLVKIECALLNSNFVKIYNATLPHFRLPYPVVPGTDGIGRVVQTGPDATSLKTGQLVFIAAVLAARDDPSIKVVRGVWQGAQSEHKHLYSSLARNSVYAEYMLAPLETTFALDEARLLGKPSAGGLGYQITDLLQLAANAIVYAGLRSIDLHAGERIIVTPATGHYSAAAVDVAVAMGARVVAASRNTDGLAKLKLVYPNVTTVTLTGDLEADSKAFAALGTVDAVIDVGPPAATGSNGLEAAVSSLRYEGRVSLIGGRLDDKLPIPYVITMLKSLVVKGQFMFNHEHRRDIVKLAESGLLKVGGAAAHKSVLSFGIDQIGEAMKELSKHSESGSVVVIKP